MPSVAARELVADPEAVFEILWYRAYARAKQLVDQADTAAKRAQLPASELITLVDTIEFAIVEEERAKIADG